MFRINSNISTIGVRINLKTKLPYDAMEKKTRNTVSYSFVQLENCEKKIR